MNLKKLQFCLRICTQLMQGHIKYTLISQFTMIVHHKEFFKDNLAGNLIQNI
jgi:hypothetical protein